jgi:hypothetical protein
MRDPRIQEIINPDLPREREGLEVMQAFVASHRPLSILLAVLLAQLLLLSFQITRNHNVRLIRIWALAVFDPFERSLKGITDTTTWAWRTYGGLWRAQQENRDLRRELTTTRSQLRQVAEYAEESERLRRLLDFKARAPFQTVAAEIIAFSPGAGSNAILIDKGIDYGLTPDLAVITSQGLWARPSACITTALNCCSSPIPRAGWEPCWNGAELKGCSKAPAITCASSTTS